MEYQCDLTGASVQEDCLTGGAPLNQAVMCIPRLALRYRAQSLDMTRFHSRIKETIMAQAAEQEKREEQMILRPGMTEAELDALLDRARGMKRAIAYGKRRLEPLRAHAAALRDEIKRTVAAINDLEEGRIPKDMPKIRMAPAVKRQLSPDELARRRKAIIAMNAARAKKRAAAGKPVAAPRG